MKIAAEPFEVPDIHYVAGRETEQTGRKSRKKELRAHGLVVLEVKDTQVRCGLFHQRTHSPATIRRATRRRFRMSSPGLAESKSRSARFPASIVPRCSS